jgi:cyclohexanecarboxylate-CoA ligase
VRGDRPGDRAADHLDELRKYLSDEGMTEWYLPTRLEYVERLPRNGNGTAKCARSYSGTGGKPSVSDEWGKATRT